MELTFRIALIDKKIKDLKSVHGGFAQMHEGGLGKHLDSGDFSSSAELKMNEPEKYQLSPDESEPHDWLMLLCMAFSDGDTSSCFDWKELASLRPFTWVSVSQKLTR
ncbi:hypothetical protein AVEN_214047-1 [Araneus ventricosus]|uniref:Uncharacterized protein n=1 Tax=Araneus ventricosus TaxID=182803 RepID=A0A4Y2VJY4_ARAVE|nr:hypothetical protein AVEN_214047-1 [Araneus ventricosus]